ncbi:lysophospholipase [Actinomycetaceae bacterium TAE3-ERU4]|nr:lysophospholipase [Actinomycetaceae bacterium TAE3-ERU4]
MTLHGKVDPTENPCAVALIAHGYAEHLGRYQRLTEALNRAGITVYRYDHHGHGKSAGPRANVDVNDLVRQHYRARKQIEQLHPNLPLFLIGHSMGGLITAASALGRPNAIAGVVLSAPALGANTSLKGPLADAVYELGRLLPKIPAGKLNPNALSNDPGIVEEYLNDPLNYNGSVPLLTGASIVALGQRILEHCPKWTPDTLILQGQNDTIVSLEATRRFAQDAGTTADVPPTIDYVEVPDAQHEVLNETEGPILMSLISQWIKDHL